MFYDVIAIVGKALDALADTIREDAKRYRPDSIDAARSRVLAKACTDAADSLASATIIAERI